MLRLTATAPLQTPPAWAVLERQLLELMDQAVHPFLAKYTRADGSLIWSHPGAHSEDDWYESFYNWPLLYALGGGDHLLDLGARQWEAVTRQLTGFGLVHQEYARRDDQFHQGEGDIYFYLLCLVDPHRPEHQERARRFAGLYLNEHPEVVNYDFDRRLVRSPYNGSAPPDLTFFRGGEPSYGWSAGMARYGLPYYDLPGITRVEDLKDPDLARRMGRAMEERMSRGDVAPNLALTSLVTNAWLLTGEERYRRWVLDYVEVWAERARANGGLLPDNVGLSGQVGEYLGGRWYGGLYGWTWPHGFYNLQMAATLAAANALLLSGDARYLELPRQQLARVMDLGEQRHVDQEEMSLREHWIGQLEGLGPERTTFLVPYRHGEAGWFDWQPLSPIYPMALWNLSMEARDWAGIERLRQESRYDWACVQGFHTKEDAGHEQPWSRFLAGENPGYPEAALQAAWGQVCRRLALIEADPHAEDHTDVHHWQKLNPVTTEALIQLTLGAPQLIYNGGLLACRVRYFDAEERRPGLPRDVAALVERLEAERTVLRLVNLSPRHPRRVLVQGGAYGEHRFGEVRYTRRSGDYPGPIDDYAAPAWRTETTVDRVDGTQLQVDLPPATEIVLDLTTLRYRGRPAARSPW
jgi:hypothetical protein